MVLRILPELSCGLFLYAEPDLLQLILLHAILHNEMRRRVGRLRRILLESVRSGLRLQHVRLLHTDANADGNPDIYSDRNTNSDSDSNRDTDRHAYADTDAESMRKSDL